MQRLIDRIREKYPCPKRLCDIHKFEDYCVMVAFSRFHGHNDYLKFSKIIGFPEGVVSKITRANDKGNFEEAWELLSQAIEPQSPAPCEENGEVCQSTAKSHS